MINRNQEPSPAQKALNRTLGDLLCILIGVALGIWWVS